MSGSGPDANDLAAKSFFNAAHTANYDEFTTSVEAITPASAFMLTAIDHNGQTPLQVFFGRKDVCSQAQRVALVTLANKKNKRELNVDDRKQFPLLVDQSKFLYTFENFRFIADYQILWSKVVTNPLTAAATNLPLARIAILNAINAIHREYFSKGSTSSLNTGAIKAVQEIKGLTDSGVLPFNPLTYNSKLSVLDESFTKILGYFKDIYDATVKNALSVNEAFASHPPYFRETLQSYSPLHHFIEHAADYEQGGFFDVLLIHADIFDDKSNQGCFKANGKNPEGLTALDLAEKLGKAGFATVLISIGVKRSAELQKAHKATKKEAQAKSALKVNITATLLERSKEGSPSSQNQDKFDFKEGVKSRPSSRSVTVHKVASTPAFNHFKRKVPRMSAVTQPPVVDVNARVEDESGADPGSIASNPVAQLRSPKRKYIQTLS